MSLSRKRPTFLRLVVCLVFGLLISIALLFGVHFFYQSTFDKSALKEPYFVLAGISTLLITLLFLFPANKPNRLLKGLGRLVTFVLLVALLWAGGAFYLVQNEFLYQPQRVTAEDEQQLLANPAVEVVHLTHPDHTESHGYLWRSSGQRSGLIIYFGGNGDMAVNRMASFVQMFQDQAFGTYHLLMMDYPGYGQSTGETSEDSIYRMAQAAWSFAENREDVDPDRIVLAGWSMGTGTASRLAAEKNPAGLLLLAPFYNGTEMVNDFIPKLFSNAPENMLQGPLTLLVRNPYKSDEYARRVTAPSLVIGAKNDTIIPVTQAERLESLFADGEFLMLEGGHSAMFSDQRALLAIADFLGKVSLSQ